MTLRSQLKRWYAGAARSLPWRGTRDPYCIWISEVMLQQTRAAAVIPYYERFLARFPNVESLAQAGESDVIQYWSGLGYYSRARNLQKAARKIAASGEFPRSYPELRLLPGIGDYTAAAIASIAFNLPYAVLDGNVKRVLSRLTGERGDIGSVGTRNRLQAFADRLLDRRDPGDFNQALMELGATLCLPKVPQCPLCPVSVHCEALRLGMQRELPVSLRRTAVIRIRKTVLIIVSNGKLLFWRRTESPMAGFWELPEQDQVPGVRLLASLGSFCHSITNHNYTVEVASAGAKKIPGGFEWISKSRLQEFSLSTMAKKALKFIPAS